MLAATMPGGTGTLIHPGGLARTIGGWVLVLVALTGFLTGCLPGWSPAVERGGGIELHGRIEHVQIPLPGLDGWPVRSAQALTTDVANGATVSLIETDSGETVSTAVSSDDGMFTVTFPKTFVPAAGKPYYLEAVKGLPVGGGKANRAGVSIARVRTLVLFGGSWSSLSGSEIMISRATTAVAAIAGHRNLAVADQIGLLGKVSGNSFAAGGTAVASEDFDRVMALVSDALLEDQDPVESIGYFAAGTTAALRYARKPGSLMIHRTIIPPRPAPNTTVTFRGQYFPLPGPATPSVFIGRFELVGWTVNATRSDLVGTVPVGAFGGFLKVIQGGTTWTGPFVPVAGTVGTFAGNGTAGHRDGPGAQALFNWNAGIALGTDGSLYVGDCNNNRIRKVALDGNVSTLAGSGAAGYLDGPGSQARFNCPGGIAMLPGGLLAVADLFSHSIRLVAPDGNVSTLAGNGTQGYAEGTGSQARFSVPHAVGADGAGNVYVGDYSNHRVRRITPAGVTSTLAGSGVAGFANGAVGTAQFNGPVGVAVAPSGDVYVGDRSNYRIRKISAGVVSTVAGSGVAGFADGPAATAQFNFPNCVTLDAAGNVYLAEEVNHRIRMVTPGGIVSTFAGTGAGALEDGPRATAKLNRPFQMVFDPQGVMYVSELANNAVRVISP